MKTRTLFSWTVSLMSFVLLATQALAQQVRPAEAHQINVGEYLLFLNAVAGENDEHGLYDIEGLGLEIVAQEDFFSLRKSNRIFYIAAEGIDPASSIFGLTELQALRYCNWVENGSQRAKALATTETGSYDLTASEVVINEQAQHHIVSDVLHPGCFIITTRSSDGEEPTLSEQATSPLMMFSGEHGKQPNEETRDHNSQRIIPADPRHEHESGSGEAAGDNTTPRGELDQEQGIDERGSEIDSSQGNLGNLVVTSPAQLTLAHFRAALEAHPEAERFVIVTHQNGTCSIEPEAADPTAFDRTRDENMQVMEMLQNLIPSGAADDLLQDNSSANVRLSADPLSAPRLRAILERTAPIAKIPIPIDEKKQEAPPQGTAQEQPPEPSTLEQLEQLIKHRIKTIFQEHNEKYGSLTTESYQNANQHWRKLHQAWEERTKTQRVQQDKTIIRDQLKAVLQQIEKTQNSGETTFLQRVANFAGAAATPLSYIPGPVPLGGVAHAVSFTAETIHNIWSKLDKTFAQGALAKAEDHLKTATKEAEAAHSKLDELNNTAKESETSARMATAIARKTAAESTYPPLRDFDESSWRAWATRLLGGADEHWIELLTQQAILNPAWAARAITNSWREEALQQPTLPLATVELSSKIKQELQEAQQSLTDAESKATKAQQEAEKKEGQRELAYSHHQELTQKLEKLNTELNRLDQTFQLGSAEKVAAARDSFLEIWEELKNNCDIINNFNRRLRELLDNQALAESEARLSQDRYRGNKKFFDLHQERLQVLQENPFVKKVPFRLPKHSYESLTAESLTAQEIPIETPFVLNRVIELVTSKENIISPHEKRAPLYELKTPTGEDLARWETRKKVERLTQEKEKQEAALAALYHEQKESVQAIQAPIATRLATIGEQSSEGNDSNKGETETDIQSSNLNNSSKLFKKENETRSQTGSTTSSIRSYFTTKTHQSNSTSPIAPSQRPNIKKLVSSKSSESGNSFQTAKTGTTSRAKKRALTTLEEDLKENEHLLKQAQEELLEQTRRAEERHLGEKKLDEATLLETWKEIDERAEESLREEERVTAVAKSAIDRLKDWDEDTRRWEARWRADYAINLELRKQAEQEWRQLAESSIMTFSTTHQISQERLSLELEKLQEKDESINDLWKEIQILYKNTTQEELLKKLGSLRTNQEQQQEIGAYKFELDWQRMNSTATLFAKADEAFNKGEETQAATLEQQALSEYAKETRIKALEDARKKTPGARDAWKHRVERSEKKYQLAQQKAEQENIPLHQKIEQRKKVLLQSDREAQQLFEEMDREYDQIEKIWVTQLQQEKRASEIATWRAAHDFIATGDTSAWSRLSESEKRNYNSSLLKANETRDERSIEQIGSLLQKADMAFKDAKLMIPARLWVKINKQRVLVTGDLKLNSLEQAQSRLDEVTNYLTQLTKQEELRSTWYQQHGMKTTPCLALEEAKSEVEVEIKEIKKGLEPLKERFYPSVEKKLKARAGQLQEKADKANSVANIASNKAHAALAREAGPLFDEAIARREEAVAAWDETLKAYAQGLSLVPEHRENLKTWWKKEIENTENAKNQSAAKVTWYMASKAKNVARIAFDKAYEAPYAKRVPLFEEAITRSKEAVAAWDETLKAYAQGLSLVPEHREDLKIWWKTSIETAENNKNLNAVLGTARMASKANSLAYVASDKAYEARTSAKRVPLLDEAIARRKEAVATWDEALKALRQGLSLVPEHREDLKTWWKKEIERAENAKNQNTALVTWYMASKANSLAIVAGGKADAALATQASPLYDKAIARREEAVAAWDETLKAYAQGLSPVPEHREDFKTWWKREIERAENLKNKNAANVTWYMASKANSLAIVAEVKAHEAPAAKSVPLFDEAIARRKEAVAAWDETLKAYAQGLSLVPANREDLKTWWKKEIERAKDMKNQNAALVTWHMANKGNSLADVASDKAHKALATEAGPLFEGAIARREEAVAAWDETLKAYAQGLSLVPANREDLKTWWKEVIKNAEICLMVSKAESMAITAEGKAWRAPAAEADSLWSAAIARREEAIVVYDKALKLWRTRLIEANRDDDITFWKKEIERAEHLKNQNAALVTWYMASKANSLAITAEGEAWRAPATQASPFYNKAIARRKEAVAAWDEALKALRQGLSRVPADRDDDITWWEKEIERAEHLKNQSSTQLAALESQRALAQQRIEPKTGDGNGKVWVRILI